MDIENKEFRRSISRQIKREIEKLEHRLESRFVKMELSISSFKHSIWNDMSGLNKMVVERFVTLSRYENDLIDEINITRKYAKRILRETFE